MKKLIAFAAFSALFLQAQAQSITGKISDANTNEALPAAAVTVYPGPKGAVSNENGRYIIKLPEAGNYTVEVTFIGYQPMSKEIYVSENGTPLNFELSSKKELLDPVNISAVRASENVPIAKTNLDKEEIEKRDEGRDVPFILKDMPSTVVSSDAGTGIGYTGIRIRGSDITRINVTVNGVPLNDPESHGVFWVNTPDLISSTNSLQVQRGVGTSTNGAGAFGASVNLKTSGLQSRPFANTELTAGSFNTLKTNIQVGSGLLNDHWVVEGRLSKVASDGFIDRASADLQSYYLSGSYYSENTSVQLIHFGGGEETYQAWWGVPEPRLESDSAGMAAYVGNNGLDSAQAYNLFNSDPRTYNYYTYENETDNYQQDHYQLHVSQKIGDHIVANAALHYTWGRGYYEQYRRDDDLIDYGLDTVLLGTDTITSTDLIRRRWLNNDFYGGTYSLEYNKDDLNITLGGAYNFYRGDHYGEIIWARYASGSEIRDRYYDNTSEKSDFNTYLKVNKTFGKLTAFVDLQVRAVDYTGQGVDDDGSPINIDADFNFFNPKAGLNYQLNENSRAYASVGVAQREPVRTDFLDAPAGQVPTSEMLIDYEAGYELRTESALLNANLFYMDYRDQLVLTGQINDVGAALRVNVSESYRTGIELTGQYALTSWLNVGLNMALSQNKIVDYEEYTPVYGEDFSLAGYDTLSLASTDISLSPSVIGGVFFSVRPLPNFEISWNTKYVGRQYLDNTSNPDRSLDPFTVTDLRLGYDLKTRWFDNVNFHLLVANLFNEQYEPNGYTYSYSYLYRDMNNEQQKATVTDNHYFPMAGTNFLAGIKISF